MRDACGRIFCYTETMKTKTINGFFMPRSIAVVGAIERDGAIGAILCRNLLSHGYVGEVFFVNPNHATLFDQPCYPTVESIGKEIDLVLIAVPASAVAAIVTNAAPVAKNFVVISAGFGESGAEGRAREQELARISQEEDLNILGPNCLGFLVPSLSLNASFASGMPHEGSVALVSQSGALAVALLDRAAREQIGFSRVISIGNKMDMDESVLLEDLADDLRTNVIALYVEGIKNGAAFMAAAQKAASKKPVILLKAGVSDVAQKAITLHTGALAGVDDVMSAVFEKTGVMRAKTIEEFFTLIKICSMLPERFFAQKNEKISIAVITNAGGPGVITADHCRDQAVAIAQLSEKTKDALRRILPAAASVENPIDLLGDADAQRYRDAIRIAMEDGAVDALLVLLTPQEQTPVEEIAQIVIDAARVDTTPIIVSFIGGERVRSAMLRLARAHIPSVPFPERAVDALNAIAHRAVPSRNHRSAHDAKRQEDVGIIFARAVSEWRNALYYDEIRAVCAAYGLPTMDAWRVEKDGTPDGVSYPCVAKIDSVTILHKTDVQGVILPLRTSTELATAIATLTRRFPGERIIVQSLLSREIEIILGIHRDPVFGPIAVMGIGGIYAEVFNRKQFFVPPLSPAAIMEEMVSGPLGFFFRWTRGSVAIDANTVSALIAALLLLADENPIVQSLDVNPLLVYNGGKDVIAADLKILLKKS